MTLRRRRPMRRLAVTLLAALGAAGALAPAATADDVSLQLRWHLDSFTSAPSGVDTPDSSGNGHTGNIVGSVRADGAFTSAVSGNGSIASSATAPAVPAQPTVMAWVRANGVPTNGSTEGWIVASGNSDGCGSISVPYALHVESDGRVDFLTRDSGNTFHASPTVGPLQIWDGLWHAVAGVYDGSSARLYVDGAEVGSGTTAPAIAPTGSGFSAGNLVGGCDEPYTGDYDEVRLYDRALSGPEIAYLQGSPHGPQPRVLPVPPATPALVSARLPLDQIDAGNTTPDISGQGNDGNTVGATVVPGKYGSALTFPNNTSGGFLINDDDYLHPQQFTITTWVNYTRTVNDHSRTIVGKGAGAVNPYRCSSHSWALRNAVGDGTPQNFTTGLEFYVNVFTPDGGQTFVSPPVVPFGLVYDGTWHAVAATYGSGTAKVYVDGVLQGTGSLPPAAIGPSGVPEEVDYGARYSNSQIGVGRYPDPTCALQGFVFPGAVDDLRIYDRVLTPEQIQAVQDPNATVPPDDPALPVEPTPSPSPSPSPSPTPSPGGTGSPTPGPGNVPLPPPVLGETLNVKLVSGKVLVRLPNGQFVPLTDPRQIIPGAVIDARKGVVELTGATLTTRSTQPDRLSKGLFSKGIFTVTQSSERRFKGLIELGLASRKPSGVLLRKGCKTTQTKRHKTRHKGQRRAALGHAAKKKKRAKVLNLLKSDAHGRFRTRGKYSAATVRGTKWDMADRCDGTLTRVHRGSVEVRDLLRHKRRIVTAGHSYLAKP